MREHSHVVRQWTSSKGVDKIEENQVLNVEGDARTIIVTICRIRQRILTQAWSRWVHNSGVHHDYEKDIKLILSRKLPDDGLRTELEVEVLFKWVEQVKDVDPTGIANTIYQCKSKAAVYNALQQLRLEFYEPGETILFQGDLPRPEDGHFTILNGSCEVVQFPEDSLPLLKLQTLARKRRWDEAKQLLLNGQILAKIKKSSGFGELATLTNTKRAASTRTARKESLITEILVLPKEPLLDCLKAKRDSGVEGAATSEAIDYMRQSGLANRISSNDLVLAANSMLRRTLLQGEILYCKGEPVSSLFLVVSGEFLLDTGEVYHDGKLEPFIRSQADKCYHLSSGSMLGDEGVTGQSNTFESTAVVVSEAAVVFEAVGYGVHFLAERIGALRYCALAYKLKSRWSTPVPLAEQINPYTYFNSLRKAIALSQPFRGTETSSLSSNIDINMKNNKPPPKSADGRSSRERSGSRNWVKRLSVSVEGRRGSKSRGETPEHRITAVAAFLVDRVDTRGFSLRKLNTVGLHHAIEINKIAKKRHHQTVKQHAKVV